MRASVPEAHVLVADDNSPDGTARVADELAATDDHVQVMHRLGKEGWVLPTSPASPGRWTTATTSWSRWTPTAVTSRSSCRCCSMRCATRIWSWVRAGYPVGRW